MDVGTLAIFLIYLHRIEDAGSAMRTLLAGLLALSVGFQDPIQGSGSVSVSRPVVEAFWAAGIQEDPGDIDGYGVEPDNGVYDRIDPYRIDFDLVLVSLVRNWKWRMWSDHGVEFFIHPAMQASPRMGFPEFFRHDRDGHPRGVIQVVKAARP